MKVRWKAWRKTRAAGVRGPGYGYGAGVRLRGRCTVPGPYPPPVLVPHGPKRMRMSGGSWPSTQTGRPPVPGRGIWTWAGDLRFGPNGLRPKALGLWFNPPPARRTPLQQHQHAAPAPALWWGEAPRYGGSARPNRAGFASAALPPAAHPIWASFGSRLGLFA